MSRTWLLVVTGVLLLAACGSDDAADSGTSGGSSNSGSEIGVVSPDGSAVTFSPQSSPQTSPGATSASGSTVPGATTPSGTGSATATTRPGSTVPGGTSAPAGTATATTASRATLPSTTLSGPTIPPTGSTVATTVAPTTLAPTTVANTSPPSTSGAPVCQLPLILEQTETNFEGITGDQLACAATWAAWSGFPDDPITTDGYFAVAEWTGVAWQLRNLGTSGVCTDAGVPTDLWPTLGCFE